MYRMTVHLFGGIWSPSCANYALHRAALDQAEKFDEQTVQTVLRDFYMDDCLRSLVSVQVAIHLVKDIVQLLSSGGFRLTKWMSNSREVLKSIESEERAKDIRNLYLRES